jgi:hypothetical protein
LFKEEDTSVRVSESIPIYLLGAFSLLTFALGLFGFYVMIAIGFLWFLGYYVGLAILAIEIVHALTFKK